MKIFIFFEKCRIGHPYVHMDVDEAALHLYHTVVSLLCILLVIEEEEASCLVGINEVDVKNPDVEAGEA